MNKITIIPLSLILLTACGAGTTTMTDRSHQPCGDSPRCVSTQDDREDFNLAPFELTDDANINQIETVALSFPRSSVAAKEGNYLRIEYKSKVFRYVDDMELKIEDGKLLVRSEARIGYYDFKVNRKRVEEFRAKLIETGLIVKP
ncbi:DUF1499 domain-containing protein [Vibrio methylphosphonaticus]|uniref:DUF1499 domain-containing protein n=1 Tax=Vibrio methylphosphonaticus TaxID=2946866 RepID=UPI00202AB28C|nr:DUF1499 domain-containing protein [Vibrio methylphosphonaticus]MCL9773371.1 DUF1499 domain-containing protein [Vibrio methylphosphonaticus]